MTDKIEIDPQPVDFVSILQGLAPELTEAEWDAREKALQRAQEALLDSEAREAMELRKAAVLVAQCRERDVSLVTSDRLDLTASAIRQLAGQDRWPTERSVAVLSGGVGSGKTVAATWWLYHHGGPKPRLLRASTFERTSRYDKAMEQALAASTALVLDDLGAEYQDAKGNFSADLDELVDMWSGGFRPMLITTNLKWQQFRDRYGERVWSRLHGGGVWIPVKDGDRRK